MSGDRPSNAGSQTFRSFWHGRPLSSYELLCMRSFVDRGHQVEVFTYDDHIAVPDWAVRRDANEILPTADVLHYQTEFGRGSPALHANLFRYTMLRRLGGWWVDLDVVLLRADVPDTDLFFAAAPLGKLVFNGVLKFPPEHPLLVEAVELSSAVNPREATWGETGPVLLTKLLDKHGLVSRIWQAQTAYPLSWKEVIALFDPAQCGELQRQCAGSWFVHFYNNTWRSSGIPRELGPPKGSFLDWLFAQHDFGVQFKLRMEFRDVACWIENFQQRVGVETRCQRLEEKCREYETKSRAYPQTGG